MPSETKTESPPESPAIRLGILYVATFCVIVLISGISQYYVLRELAWHGETVRYVADHANDPRLGHSLSQAALKLMAAEPFDRGPFVRALRDAIQAAPFAAPGESDDHGLADGSTSDGEDGVSTLMKARVHEANACRAAVSLLARMTEDARAAPPPSETRPLLETILSEEQVAGRMVAEAAQRSAAAASDQVDRLGRLESSLFGLVLIALLIEGLFVIRPAVLRIQQYMVEQDRAHESLKVYARKLERSNTELQDFASVASHDLQEPLRKVQAFSDRLRTRSAAVLDEQCRDFLDRIQNAAGRMQTLINDLLTYSRVTSKARPFVPTNLTSVTREVVSDLETRIEQVGGRVEIGDLPTVDADPLLVRQLMQNLIGNSLKYRRPEVPPVVRVSGRALREDAAAAAVKPLHAQCEIAVEDNGIGFEEIYSERIFTIFQRLHGRSEYEGTGVGLAVCRKIVDRHGGTITAQGRPGIGSTFVVTLPLRQLSETGHDDSKA